MKGKDPKIEYEMRSLADANLPDADRILAKARAEMRKPKPEKKRAGFMGVFAVAAAAAAVIFVIVLGLRLPFFDNNKGGNIPDSSDSPSAAPGYSSVYSSAEIIGRRVSYAQASHIFEDALSSRFPLPAPDSELSGGCKFAECDYYVYRHKVSGDDVLIECDLRIYGEAGFDEITVYLELTEDIYSANKDYLDLPLTKGNVKYGEIRENGEYVSRAYIADKYKCMLEIMNGNEYRLDYYLDLLGMLSEGAQS